MKSLIIVLIPLFLLSGCATANSNSGLTVVAYSRDVQIKAAQELEQSSCPTLGQMMLDYSVLRDQARVE